MAALGKGIVEDLRYFGDLIVAGREALGTQLPKDVVVFHSYPWLRLDRDLDMPWQGEAIREGEADCDRGPARRDDGSGS